MSEKDYHDVEFGGRANNLRSGDRIQVAYHEVTTSRTSTGMKWADVHDVVALPGNAVGFTIAGMGDMDLPGAAEITIRRPVEMMGGESCL